MRSLDAKYTYNTTGTGVKVYIIDSGIRLSDTDFGGRVIYGFSAFLVGQPMTSTGMALTWLPRLAVHILE